MQGECSISRRGTDGKEKKGSRRRMTSVRAKTWVVTKAEPRAKAVRSRKQGCRPEFLARGLL